MASSYNSRPLMALAEFIYRNARREVSEPDAELEETNDKLDAVVLTGDIATTGDPLDIGKAKLFLDATSDPKVPYRAATPEYRGATLSASRIPIIKLPGNHDRYVETWDSRGPLPILYKPGGKEFDARIFDYGAPKKPVYAFPFSAPINADSKLNVVVICADLSLQDIDDTDGTRFGWLAQGVLYSDVRKRLVQKTVDVRNETPESDVLVVLWAVHFPPFYPGISKHSRLLGEEELVSLANELEVAAILGGHTHQQLQYKTPGMSFEGLCCGTTTQHEPQALIGGGQQNNVRAGNHFQILTISAEPTRAVSITVEHYRYSATTDEAPAVYEWQRV